MRPGAISSQQLYGVQKAMWPFISIGFVCITYRHCILKPLDTPAERFPNEHEFKVEHRSI